LIGDVKQKLLDGYHGLCAQPQRDINGQLLLALVVAVVVVVLIALLAGHYCNCEF
jgi:hypothetical protein